MYTHTYFSCTTLTITSRKEIDVQSVFFVYVNSVLKHSRPSHTHSLFAYMHTCTYTDITGLHAIQNTCVHAQMCMYASSQVSRNLFVPRKPLPLLKDMCVMCMRMYMPILRLHTFIYTCTHDLSASQGHLKGHRTLTYIHTFMIHTIRHLWPQDAYIIHTYTHTTGHP
jgi:hypothetical protein